MFLRSFSAIALLVDRFTPCGPIERRGTPYTQIVHNSTQAPKAAPYGTTALWLAHGMLHPHLPHGFHVMLVLLPYYCARLLAADSAYRYAFLTKTVLRSGWLATLQMPPLSGGMAVANPWLDFHRPCVTITESNVRHHLTSVASQRPPGA